MSDFWGKKEKREIRAWEGAGQFGRRGKGKKTQDKSDFRPERKKADKVKGRCGCLEGKE